MIVTHNLQQAYRVADQRRLHVPRRAGRVRAGRAGLRRAAGAAHARLRQRGLWLRAARLPSCSPRSLLGRLRVDAVEERAPGAGGREGACRGEGPRGQARRTPTSRWSRRRALEDENGAAAVVVLTNTGGKRRSGTCRSRSTSLGKGRKSVFKNDTAGPRGVADVDRGAAAAASRFAWVNDQLVPTAPVRASRRSRAKEGGASSARAAADRGRRADGWTRTRSRASRPPAACATARDIDQRLLTLYCVARKGGQIVAAGRAAGSSACAAGKGATTTSSSSETRAAPS